MSAACVSENCIWSSMVDDWPNPTYWYAHGSRKKWTYRISIYIYIHIYICIYIYTYIYISLSLKKRNSKALLGAVPLAPFVHQVSYRFNVYIWYNSKHVYFVTYMLFQGMGTYFNITFNKSTGKLESHPAIPAGRSPASAAQVLCHFFHRVLTPRACPGWSSWGYIGRYSCFFEKLDH